MQDMLNLRTQYCYQRENPAGTVPEFVQLCEDLQQDPYTLPASVAAASSAIGETKLEWCDGVARIVGAQSSKVCGCGSAVPSPLEEMDVDNCRNDLSFL